jgi:hypothetical protein
VFYSNSLTITYLDKQNVSRNMIAGIDYIPMFRFVGGTINPNNPVYGAIGLLKQNLVKRITISYQAFGGGWLIDIEAVRAFLANGSFNIHATVFELTNKESIFLPNQSTELKLNTFSNIQIAQNYFDTIVLTIVIRALSATPGAMVLNAQETTIYNEMLSISRQVSADRAIVLAAKAAALLAAANADGSAQAAAVYAASALVSKNDSYQYSLNSAASASSSGGTLGTVDGGDF